MKILNLPSLVLVAFTCCCFLSTASAQEAMFNKLAQKANSVGAAKSIQSSESQLSFSVQLADSTLEDDAYFLDLPNKRVIVNKMVIPSQAAKSDSQSASQSIDVFYFVDSKGSIIFDKVGNNVVSARIYDVDAQQTFLGTADNSGQMTFTEQDINEFICVNHERAPSDSAIPNTSPEISSANPDITNTPQNVSLPEVSSLESRPGASRVIFIDYWGGTVSGTAWNATYNDGNDIVYEPYDTDNNSASFSQLELQRMYAAWAEMAEDYAPFDVNITTDIAVFNAVAVNRRSRMIATPTSGWFGDAGGVAYVGIFGNRNDNFLSIGWTWNLGFSSMGMTHSHEAGHQMGLSHDGDTSFTPTRSYYSGHSNWGPIMGAPFGKDYVQWSKGDYGNASESQDDLSIVKARLTMVPDDAGDTKANATPLDISNTDAIRLITPQGLGKDTDVYVLEQGVTSTVTIQVESSIKGLNGNTGPNLSLRAVLTDAADNIIAQVAPTNNVTTNTLDISPSLSPGTYYLSIDNESPNANPVTGFNEYGNGGYYQLSINGGVSPPGPNLLVNSIGLTPRSAEPASSDIATLSAAIRNQGFDPATSYTVDFYQSTDSVIDTSDTLIDANFTSVDLASTITSSPFEHSFTVPEDVGSYYYGACISAVSPTESNASDNCSLGQKLTIEESALCVPVKAKNGKTVLICL